MIRKMLIISNPRELGAENYCEGVNQDVIRYREFFMSAAGGSWESFEIQTLKQPLPSQVDAALRGLASANYSMVIFCGHGYSRRDGTTMVELCKGYDYDSTNLNRGAVKHSVILDCCRVVWDAALEKAQSRFDLYEFAERPISREIARARFDYALTQCQNGLVILYACDTNESAEDDSRNGGVYSHALRSAAISWSKSQTREKTASIVAMHDIAAGRVRLLTNNRQNPQIMKPRTVPYFPFVVSLWQ